VQRDIALDQVVPTLDQVVRNAGKSKAPPLSAHSKFVAVVGALQIVAASINSF
jgi:hypothetical protein